MAKSSVQFGSRPSPFAKVAKPSSARPFFHYTIFVVLVASNILMGLTLIMSPEIASLFSTRTDPVLGAYETRILHLRMEVDRLHSRQQVQTGTLNLRMQELLQQQQILSEQHEIIRVLAKEAQTLGLTTASAQVHNMPLQPGTDPIITGSLFTRQSPALQPFDADEIAQNIDRMRQDTHLVLASISDKAQRDTNTIINRLSNLGIPTQFRRNPDLSMGGPLILDSSDAPSNQLIQNTNLTFIALDQYKQARQFLTTAPIHAPLALISRISSPFGSRSDPFSGSRAYHSGIDYPAPSGTRVFSTGMGKVIFAGRKGGYGKTVEIDHGNGIISRYGHLSAILVRTGQTLSSGDVLGNVGSTGRSTGPHLHFEIRRNQSAVDPAKYLSVFNSLG